MRTALEIFHRIGTHSESGGALLSAQSGPILRAVEDRLRIAVALLRIRKGKEMVGGRLPYSPRMCFAPLPPGVYRSFLRPAKSFHGPKLWQMDRRESHHAGS